MFVSPTAQLAHQWHKILAFCSEGVFHARGELLEGFAGDNALCLEVAQAGRQGDGVDVKAAFDIVETSRLLLL